MRKSLFAGFTLIETVVAMGIFIVLVVGVINLFGVLSRTVKSGREQTILAGLASDYLEIVRNLPYSQVGTAFGNPHGNLPDQSNPIATVIGAVTYRISYEVTYTDDTADGTVVAGNDAAPNDYKQVKMKILNTTTNVTRSFLTSVIPKGLEGLSNAGALSIKVIDAAGQPIPDAAVHIQNIAGTIILDRTTDATGSWIEVGLPAGVNAYHIVVTKPGYSTDQTYPVSGGNPNPTKPDSTVSNGVVTVVSFAIDLPGNLAIKTLNSTCQNLNNVGINLLGAKLIGTSPNVYKFNQNLTSSAGLISLDNIEWDTFTPTVLTGQNLMITGTSPIQQIAVLPQASQTFTMILSPQTANSLLVVVKDSTTNVALENVSLNLTNTNITPNVNLTGITGGSILTQSSWTGGPGQTNFVNTNQYFSDDGNLDVATLPVGVRLKKLSGNYVPAGQFISSTFDTGGASNYTTLTWSPTSQNAATTLKFQIATNDDNTTWNFVGPDGTAATYYTVSGTNISVVHDNNRYLRYKAFLSTTSTAQTPVLSNVTVNYVAGCFTPGQYAFTGVAASNKYKITATLAGYTTKTVSNLNITGNQTLQILLSH